MLMANNFIQEVYPDSKNENSIQEGIEFQDFVADELYKIGCIVQNYGSRKYQFNFGENKQGWEIKRDNLCTKTKRMSIEIAEKSKAGNKVWIPSGIMRKDNTWLYIQGNYEIIAIFGKSILLNLYEIKKNSLQHHETTTIQAFYLPFKSVEKWALRIIYPK